MKERPYHGQTLKLEQAKDDGENNATLKNDNRVLKRLKRLMMMMFSVK